MAKGLVEVKQAIQGLKIGKPYDLRLKKQLEFRPPQSEEPQIEQAQKEVPQVKRPQIQETRNEAPRTEQFRSEVPKNEVAPTTAKDGGFFRLARSTFRDATIRRLPGDAFRVFVWMSSYAWGFEDSVGRLRASVGYISDGAGVSMATVSRCLRVLKEEKLISLLEVDFKKGNLWQVTDLTLWRDPQKLTKVSQSEDPQDVQPQAEHAQNDRGGCSKREGSHLSLSKEVPQSEVEIINSNNTQETKELSLASPNDDPQSEPAVIGEYFRTLRPQRKRESEKAAYVSLLCDYGPKEIEKCLAHLSLRTAEGEAIYHSPMAYLAKAMDSVLATVEHNEDVKLQRAERAEQDLAKKRLEEKKERADAEEWARKERAFNRAFPGEDRQREVLSELSRGLPLRPGGQAARVLAISKWWQGLGGFERMELG